jgi:hypothetical protein
MADAENDGRFKQVVPDEEFAPGPLGEAPEANVDFEGGMRTIPTTLRTTKNRWKRFKRS